MTGISLSKAKASSSANSPVDLLPVLAVQLLGSFSKQYYSQSSPADQGYLKVELSCIMYLETELTQTVQFLVAMHERND